MKLSKSWTTVTPFSKTLAMVLVILLPFIGFYFGYNFPHTIDSSTATPTKSVYSVDETTDWKTYTNTKFGYSIKIPENYSTNECENGQIVRIATAPQGLECQQELSGIDISYNIAADKIIGGLNSVYTINKSLITVNGITGTKYEGTLKNNPAPVPKHIIYSQLANSNHSIFVEYHDYDNGSQTEVYSHILSTFKFTN